MVIIVNYDLFFIIFLFKQFFFTQNIYIFHNQNKTKQEGVYLIKQKRMR